MLSTCGAHDSFDVLMAFCDGCCGEGLFPLSLSLAEKNWRVSSLLFDIFINRSAAYLVASLSGTIIRASLLYL